MAGFKGHLRGGMVFAAAAAVMIIIWRPTIGNVFMESMIAAAMAIVGCLLPDVDHPQSFLGRRVKLISRPIYRLFGHRTLTHSLFFVGGAMWLLVFYGQKSAALGLGMGMLSHILLDLFPLGSGVALLYPIYRGKIKLGFKHSRHKKRRKR